MMQGLKADSNVQLHTNCYCIKIKKIDRIFKSECTICQKVKKCNKRLFKLKLV